VRLTGPQRCGRDRRQFISFGSLRSAIGGRKDRSKTSETVGVRGRL
jgi:hypothetical protein